MNKIFRTRDHVRGEPRTHTPPDRFRSDRNRRTSSGFAQPRGGRISRSIGCRALPPHQGCPVGPPRHDDAILHQRSHAPSVDNFPATHGTAVGESSKRESAPQSCIATSFRTYACGLQPCCGRSKRPAVYVNPKNARDAAAAWAAVTATGSLRSRATSSQMCARYIGSLRRCAGCGRTVRGSR